MSTNANQKTTEQKPNEKVWIESSAVPFKAQGEIQFISSMRLAELFGKFFKSFLADYEGCFLMPKPGTIDRNDTYIELAVYLTNKPQPGEGSSKIKTLKPLGQINPKTAKATERIFNINSRAKQKLYEVNEDSAQIFESLSLNNVKWNVDKMVIEQVDPANRNMVYVKIIGLDPVKILKKIFGGKVEGEDYEYRISPIKMVGPNNYLLRIERLNEGNMAKLAEELGFVQPNASNILMVR